MLIGAKNLWRGGRLEEEMALVIENGLVREIIELNSHTTDLDVHLVTPYLTDLQVNGGGSAMVNSDPTPDGLRAIALAHRALGTGTFLPTVITDTHDIIEAAAAAVLEIMHEPGIGGLHIEGPHIAMERRGTHNPDFIRPLDEKTVRLVERLRKNNVRVMITLAPELVDVGLLSRLVASGAIVSGGHSAANAEQTKSALKAGLSCFTHLYNAMPPMTSREPGILGTALNSNAYAGIIVDGIHVDWDMIKIALNARPKKDLTFAVSDAMATVGGENHFILYGQKISVKDGALINSEGSLAGAHIDLVTSLKNLVMHVELPLSEAIPMVCDIPRRLMNMPLSTVDVGTPVADILALTEDFKLVDIS